MNNVNSSELNREPLSKLKANANLEAEMSLSFLRLRILPEIKETTTRHQ